MPDDQNRQLREYWQEQAERTLPIGKLTGWLGATTLPIFMAQDILFLHVGWPTSFRLLAIAASVLFLVKAHTTFLHDTSKVIRNHCLVLVSLMIQICSLTYVLWLTGSETPYYKHGTTQGITVVVLVAFLLAGGARKFLPLIVGAPFGILALLVLTTCDHAIEDLALFTNPAIVVLIVALYSRSREKIVFTEFTMRRLAEKREEELQASSEALARSNAALRGFTHAASHDLQQPLRSISGFLEIIRDELDGQGVLKERVAEYFERVTGAAHRMSELVHSLLAYSKATARQPVFATVDLNAVLTDVRNDLSSAVQAAGAEIESVPLPTVIGDVHQLSSILQNLISNAIKYARDDEPPRIRIDAADEGDIVRIRVSDNGIGFDEKHASDVFEAFRQLHNARVYGGVGIGLAICRQYVEAHNGMIGAKSDPAAGSEFWFTLAKNL
jgi:signal transduction histidine kinase